MRRFLLAACVAAGLTAGLGGGTAVAYCDPDYYPLCTNDCEMQPPDLSDLPRSLVRACPQ